MSEVKEVDRQGRIVIPAEWRKGWPDRVVLYRLSDDEIIVKALRKKSRLTDLTDSISIEADDFTDTHKLREALHG